MSLATLLDQTVNVLRKSPAKDASGGQVENFAAVAALQNVPAAVQPFKGEARRAIGQRQVFVTHHVYTQRNGWQRGDKLVHAETGDNFLCLSNPLDQGGKGRVYLTECLLET